MGGGKPTFLTVFQDLSVELFLNITRKKEARPFLFGRAFSFPQEKKTLQTTQRVCEASQNPQGFCNEAAGMSERLCTRLQKPFSFLAGKKSVYGKERGESAFFSFSSTFFFSSEKKRKRLSCSERARGVRLPLPAFVIWGSIPSIMRTAFLLLFYSFPFRFVADAAKK